MFWVACYNVVLHVISRIANVATFNTSCMILFRVGLVTALMLCSVIAFCTTEACVNFLQLVYDLFNVLLSQGVSLEPFLSLAVILLVISVVLI